MDAPRASRQAPRRPTRHRLRFRVALWGPAWLPGASRGSAGPRKAPRGSAALRGIPRGFAGRWETPRAPRQPPRRPRRFRSRVPEALGGWPRGAQRHSAGLREARASLREATTRNSAGCREAPRGFGNIQACYVAHWKAGCVRRRPSLRGPPPAGDVPVRRGRRARRLLMRLRRARTRPPRASGPRASCLGLPVWHVSSAGRAHAAAAGSAGGVRAENKDWQAPTGQLQADHMFTCSAGSTRAA